MRHQQQSAGAGLNIFFGDVLRHPGKHGRKRLARGLVDFVDREQFEANLEVAGQFPRVVNRSSRRIRPGHADADDVLGAERIGRNRRGERGIDASAESDDRPLEAAFVDVVSRAQNQRFIRAGFFTRNLRVHVPSDFLRIEFLGVEIDQVFLERLRLRDHLSVGRNHQARSVEDQAVVAPDLVHHRDRNFLILCDGRQHVAAQFALAQPKRRRGNVEHEVSAGADQFFDRIDAIQPPVPEALVVPGILTDGQSHLLAAKAEQLLALGGSEVAHLVEDVIGGQQHLRLDELDAPFAQQGGGVHRFFARVRFGRGYRAADHGNALRFCGDPLDGRATARHKRGPLDQIARRVAADGEFRKQNQASASTPRLQRKLDDLGSVAERSPPRWG